MKNKKTLLILASFVIIGLFFLAKKIYNDSENERLGFLQTENASLFVRDYSPVYGDKNAKVFVVEFLDPECESCRLFYPQVKGLLKEFEGKAKLIVRYAPFHKNSQIAIRALEAARKQGKYWDSLELLFEKQPMWGDHHNPRPELIFEFLSTLSLDMKKLSDDMKSPDIEKIIKQDFSDLKELGVRQTPTFFINGKRLERFGLTYLRDAIKAEVEQVY